MIVGLVAQLSPDDSQRTSTLAAINAHQGLDVGELQSHRLPLVLETPSESVEESTEWLRTLPAVMHVDVVYVHFDQGEQSPPHPTGP